MVKSRLRRQLAPIAEILAKPSMLHSLMTTEGWIDDEPDDDSTPDLTPRLSDADIVGAHLSLQIQSLEREGFSRFAIATALSQLASEMVWDLFEGLK
jgi:hypothetical protein